MDCPNCSAPQPDAARFCARCGTPLDPGINRSKYFAAHPEEPVRALAVMSTLMPHLSGGRHHIYRGVIALALLGSLIAAALGMLSIALILAAITLPAVVLTYMHDHNVWHKAPITVIGVAFLLSLMIGICVGLLEGYFTRPMLLSDREMPTLTQILELGILLPVVAYVAVLITPVLITARSAFRHPVDAVVICSLSGAAFSLGLSVVVQRGAFSHIGATAGNPAHVAFIALTLGFLQPIIFATAAAMAVVPLRGVGASTALGLTKGLVLVVLYELTTVLLTFFGNHGIVLTTLAALVLAAAGLLGARDALHTSLVAEAQAALTGGRALSGASDGQQICAHCGAVIGAGAAFCQICGKATAALARHPAPDDGRTEGRQTSAEAGAATSSPPQTPPPLRYPSGGERVGHRLGPFTIAAIIALVILIAATVTAVIVLGGTTSPRKAPPLLPAAMAAAAHSGSVPTPRTEQGVAITLTAADPINIAQGISITPAPGWALSSRGSNWVVLSDPNNAAKMKVTVKTAGGTDAVAVLHADIHSKLANTGMTNVSVMGVAATRTLNSRNFQRAASTDYSADYSGQMGTTHILGVFMELLNTSNRLSAFIDYRETSDATAYPDGAGQMMINSML